MGSPISNETSQGHVVVFRVRYYETDAMGIVHHSNYLRWFELARTEYLRAAGMPYREMEASGTGCPVVAVRCQYHRSARYDDEVQVTCRVSGYTGLRLTMAYDVHCQGHRLCSGETDHAFVHGGRVVAPSRSLPAIDTLLRDCLQRDSGAV